MNNDEINQKVHELLGNPYPICPQYCTNPMAAWPIILESRIDIQASCISKDWFCSVYDEDDKEIEKTNKNPLKAAMLVFIELKESEDARD